MTTRVDVPDVFKKDLKHLARKYPAVLDEVDRFISQLEADERPGDKIPNVGYDVYKVRLKNPSAKRGKSGGFRIIYYIHVANHLILVTIYSKTEQRDIDIHQIQGVIQEVINSQKFNED